MEAELVERGEGISVLLTYSMVAERARGAVSRFLDPARALTEADADAIEKAKGFLDFAKQAEVIATQNKMKGFTAEGMQVRQATHEACKTLRSGEELEFLGFLGEMRDVLEGLQAVSGVPADRAEIAKAFFTAVRDLFRARSAHAMEVVGPMEFFV